MKIYIASSSQELAKSLRQKLRNAGHEVTSRWIDSAHWRTGILHDPQERRENAIMDEEDVSLCDMLILIAEPDGAKVAGGKHVETGMAIALKKKIVILGKPENIFHYHPAILDVFSSDDELIQSYEVSQPDPQ